MKRLDYMPQLDALRALAALAVVYAHLAPKPWLPWNLDYLGGYGVKLFFVLSGFLITRLLLRLRDDPRPLRERWAEFWVRRAARLFPLFFAVLVVIALALPSLRPELPWHALYASNYYLFRLEILPPTVHFWSLAVEEQFYLLWPAAVLLTPRRWLPALFVALMPLELAAQVWHYVDGTHVYTTPAHAGTLAAGAWLGWAWERRSFAWRPALHRLGALAALVVLALHARGGHPHFPWVSPFAVLAFVALVDATAHGIGGAVGRVLEARPLRYLGQISYGVYVLHLFVVPLFLRLFGVERTVAYASPTVGVGVGAAVLTVVLAALSWELFEKPVARWVRRRWADVSRPDPFGHAVGSRR